MINKNKFKKQIIFFNMFFIINLILSFVPINSFAEPASGTNYNFNEPAGVEVDSEGNIYVADKDNDRIIKMDSNGMVMKIFEGELNSPRAVAVDRYGNMYVADTANYRVVKLDSNGNIIFAITEKVLPKEISSKEVSTRKKPQKPTHFFRYPQGIALDSSGNIYVSDTNNSRILKFNDKGEFLAEFTDDLFMAKGLFVDKSGNIYIADTTNSSVKKLDSEGNHIFTIGRNGSAPGTFRSPSDIVVANSGNIYVADTSNNRIQKFDDKGNFLTSYDTFAPHGIALDSSENVYVVNSFKDYYGKYSLKKINSQGAKLLNIDSLRFPTLSVEQSAPVNNSKDILINQNISITFNDKIFMVNKSQIKLIEKNSNIEKTFYYNISNNVLTIDSHEDFNYDTEYNLIIHPESLKGSAGAHLENNFTLSFTTKKNIDNTSPQVIKTEPLNNSTNVDIDNDLKITFSEDIKISDINSIFLKKDNNTIEYEYDISANVLTITPKESLDYNNVYTLDIKKNSIKDLSDNILDNDYKLVFTTKDQNQKNNDAFLNNIKLSSGILSPSFAKDIMNYNVTVDFNTTNIIVTPILSDSKAQMKINGVNATNNTPSDSIELNVGSNKIEILVTSEDAIVTKKYIITAIRKDKEIDKISPQVIKTEPLNNSTNVDINNDLKITFSEDIKINDINSIFLKKDNNTIEYKYKIASNVLTITPKNSLDYSSVYTLDIKKNSIKDLSDNILDNDYKLVFTTKDQNQKNNDAFLNNIKISSGNLSPSFTKAIMNYNVNVEYNTSNIVVTPILSDTKAQMKINGVSATSNTPSDPIQLKVGSNKIEILVTSEDTIVTNKYIITITRNNYINNNNNNNNTNNNNTTIHHSHKSQPSVVVLDGMIKESLKEKDEMIVSVSDRYYPKVKFRINALKKLIHKDNLLTIENKDVKISFHPKDLNINEMKNEYILFDTNILEKNKQKEIIDKLTFINKKDEFEPKGNIFNLDIENNQGNKSIEINTFYHPIKVSVELSHFENADNLTSIRYEVSDDGKIHPIKMGGFYNEKSKEFTFYTDKSGLYSIEKVDKIQTIELTINQLGSKVNNVYKTNDTTPIVINNRTMVPVRFIAESLGATVKWYPDTKTIVIEDDEKQLSMTIGKKIEDFDTEPIVLNNRTLVPIRYVSQKLGANVLWFPSKESIYIVK
ncbi:MAG: Ig-like domain-containing protein [Clostridia bacterium]|jgi:sugar lactone lactonase YvrE/methionine-rich copper-binding protein CopC|nr:Ig-like domain-containing protein [Clostridia bacterium]